MSATPYATNHNEAALAAALDDFRAALVQARAPEARAAMLAQSIAQLTGLQSQDAEAARCVAQELAFAVIRLLPLAEAGAKLSDKPEHARAAKYARCALMRAREFGVLPK